MKEIVPVLIVFSLLTASAEQLRFQDVPFPTQTKILTQIGALPVDSVSRENMAGQTIYDLWIKQDALQRELIFNEQGDLLVVNSVPISDIDRALRQSRLPDAIIRGLSSPAASTAPNRVTQQVALSDVQDVPMNLAPPTVVVASLANANGALITRFQKGIWRGRVVYQAAYAMNGQPVQFQIGEDGLVAYDPRSPMSVGAPAGIVSGTASSPSADRFVPLSTIERVERVSVPYAVERAIESSIGTSPIESINRGAWHGRNIYQIAFAENGARIETQIDEYGNVIFDPRTSTP